MFPHPFPSSAGRTAEAERLEGALVEPGLWRRRGGDGTLKTVKVTSQNVNHALGGFGQRALRPIVVAAGAGEPDEVERLLRLGADPNWVASDGSTALIRCLQTCEQTAGVARDRAVAAAHRLLEEDLAPSIDARTRELRVTALGAAVAAGLPDTVRRVLAQGASVDGRHGVEDAPPLYWAIQRWALGLLDADGFRALLDDEARRGPAGIEAALRVPGLGPLFADEARRARAGTTRTAALRGDRPSVVGARRNRADAFCEGRLASCWCTEPVPTPRRQTGSPRSSSGCSCTRSARTGHGQDVGRGSELLDLIGAMVAAGGDLNRKRTGRAERMGLRP